MGGLSSFCVLWLGRHNHPYLLRARRGTNAPALLFRSIGKSSFDKDPVKYETFTNVLTGLKSLNLVWHRKGQTRYCKSEFDPGEYVSTSLPGRASRFWATGKLMQLAELHGISSDNVREHFTFELPMHPLVLKDYAGGRGKKKLKGRRINFKHTAESARLEQELLEFNTFLSGFRFTGGEHEGYIRVFNNRSWKKGRTPLQRWRTSKLPADAGDRAGSRRTEQKLTFRQDRRLAMTSTKGRGIPKRNCLRAGALLIRRLDQRARPSGDPSPDTPYRPTKKPALEATT